MTGTAPVDASFYADPQGLAALRRDAKQADPAALREAARQFEGIFTQMMLKSMRTATPQDPLFGSDSQAFYQDMFDTQLAQQLSRGKGLGLADMLVRQLMHGGADAAGETAPAGKLHMPPAAANWPPANREEFIARLRPAAEAVGKQLGVDSDTLIAHAALETGWGRSLPNGADGESSFNLFGIKTGSSWKGNSVAALTLEYAGGVPVQQLQQFRAYSSPEACMQDYAALLGKPRYSAALGTGDDAAAFAGALQRAGYATDPDYAAKLTAVAQGLKSGAEAPIQQADAGLRGSDG